MTREQIYKAALEKIAKHHEDEPEMPWRMACACDALAAGADAPVETLADDAGCQAVVAKALYTYVRDPLVHTLLSDLDAYRAGKQR